MLERLGYTVHATTDPVRAVELFHQHRDAVDMLFSDVVMPGMNGYDLVDTLRREKPDLRILMASGYDAEDRENRATFRLLPKPYTMEELAVEVRTSMGDPAFTQTRKTSVTRS